MLAPLLQWRPTLGAELGVADALTLGRGQTLGLHGPGWRDAFTAYLAAARDSGSPFRRLEADDVRVADAETEPPSLWLVSCSGDTPPALVVRLLEAAEKLARRGGGAIIGADSFSREARAEFTRMLEFPLRPDPGERKPELLDDSGKTVNHVRQGDWCGLHFPLAPPAWPEGGELRLVVEGEGTSWRSPPAELAPWRRFMPRPTGCVVSFAIPWPPGRYTARLVVSRSGKDTREAPALLVNVRRTDPVSDRWAGYADSGPPLQWRFTGLPALQRQSAALNLRLPPRAGLDFSEDDREHLLRGWHGKEASGEVRFKRWTMGEAVAALGASGRRLAFRLYDFRPRGPDTQTTEFAVDIDGISRHEFLWQEPGFHEFSIPWIGDGLTHIVTMRVHPTWCPANEGAEDQRELGVLFEGLQVEDE